MRTVLITGASSGIGAGLAAAFHARGDRVIAVARDTAALARLAATHPGIEPLTLDVTDPDAVTRAAAEVAARHPTLDMLINNAGVQRRLDFTAADPVGPDAIRPEIATNFEGFVNVTAAFLPLLRRQPEARLVHVTSGLAFVPLAAAPVYSATKTAARAFTIALRKQLAGTDVQVVELIPPVVATALHRGQARTPPNAMSLDKFVAAAMRGLDGGDDEVAVGLAGVSKVAARVAPGLFLTIVDKPR